MADGLFYTDLREPFIGADVAAVTLAATFKALYPAANFPLLGGQYFSRIGKRMKIRLFGRITTGATPGNFQLGVYYGTGGDANGVQLAATTAQALTAGQTNLSWEAEVNVHCRSLGAAGTLFATGRIMFNEAVCAPHIMLPGSAPAVSGACDLTAALLLSVQANRSGSTAEAMTLHDMEVVAMN